MKGFLWISTRASRRRSSHVSPGRLGSEAAPQVEAGAAFIPADGADVVPGAPTAGRQQPGAGDAGGLRTLDLAVGLWKGPQTILQTHQPVAVA